MNSPKKLRPADVARWVAALSAPEPSRWNVCEHKEWKRDKDKARGMLRSWGLGDGGLPLETPDDVAARLWSASERDAGGDPYELMAGVPVGSAGYGVAL